MIRYTVGVDHIHAEIDGLSATWRTRAADRTQESVDARKYEESSSIWSEVKPVYIALQANKCVFCERKLETVEYGKLEFDLEHFRPKSSVKVWPPANNALNYEFDTGPAAGGYFWLAYDVANYAASCKPCNTKLKSNYFPIAGARGSAVASPAELATEQPFLCYPIGDLDEDPEDLVTFTATIAVPAAADGYRRRRGQVIIDFFRLNQRETLHQERAQMIMMLYDALREVARDEDPDEVALAQQVIARITSEDMRHAACSRAYYRLWDHDNALARQYGQRCKHTSPAASDWQRSSSC